jgi:uncharacterized protein (TIGR02300 family)
VAKPELGAKRQCQNCGAKFFDMNKDPIVCPKCGTIFQGAARVERAAAKAEVEEDEVVAPVGVELVSLDEVEASEEKAAEPAVEDVDVEEGEAEPDDPFIEAEEEDEDDVTNLIDGDIAPDEEP